MWKLKFFHIFALVFGLLMPPATLARRPQSFRIGSVFLEPDTLIHQAFVQTLLEINKNENFLNGTRIDHNIQYVQDDPFDAHQKICMEMSYRVVTVFGSSFPSIDRNLGSVCSALHIPYMTTSLAPANQIQNDYVLHLGPSQMDLIEAVADIMEKLRWEEVALVTHRETGTLDSYQLIELLQRRGFRVRLLDLKHADIRPGVVELRNQGIQQFLVDVGTKHINLFFDQAMKSGIVHSGSTFLPLSLDLSTINMEAVRHTGATVFGLSIVDKDLIEHKKVTGELSKESALNLADMYRSALLHDGVHLFAKAVEKLIEETDLTTPQVTCDDKEVPYDVGESLLKKINEEEYEGVTGRLSLKNGLRQNVQFTIIKLNVSGEFTPIGRWTANGGDKNDLTMDDSSINALPMPLKQIKPTLRVQTVTTPTTLPYMMKKGSEYEGFLVDLLSELSKDVGFQFVIEESTAYGKLNPESGNWTGVVGKLMEREADIGLADLTITPDRNKVVDFSPPYQTLSNTILTKKQSSENGDYLAASMVSYLNPFSVQMWISILIAYFLTSLLLFVVGRLSPYDRQDRLTISNSFWFTLTGILQRSTNSLQPKSLSTRFLSAFWWLFCLVLMVLYIVSLTTGLFKHINQKLDLDVDWFIRNDEAKLVTMFPGSTAKMLMDSRDPLQQNIWSKIEMTLEGNDSFSFSSTSEAVDATSKIKNLGFVMESSHAEFVVAQKCDLTTVGSFGLRQYGVAFPKGSPYKDSISNQILIYGHDGTLESLRQKWISKISECHKDSGINGINEDGIYSPTVYSILGPFLLLLAASLASLLLALIELIVFSIIAARKNPRRGTLGSILKAELVKAIRCYSSKGNRADLHGSTPGGLNGMNGSGYRYGRPTNGTSDPSKSSTVKNGHNFYQAQALLRKDAADDVNSQL